MSGDLYSIKYGVKWCSFSFQSYFITFPDGHMLNTPEFKAVESNVTAIRLMTEDDIEANNIVNSWKRTKMYLNAEQSRVAERIASPNRLKVNKFTF